MKINKQKDSLMRRHTQTVRGNEHTKEVCLCLPVSYFIHTDNTKYCRWCGEDYK